MTTEYIVTKAQSREIVAAIREALTAAREHGYAASTYVHDRHTHVSILEARRERAGTIEADKQAEMWIAVFSAFEAEEPAPARCGLHPAFDADYCPSCGTARVIGSGQ